MKFGSGYVHFLQNNYFKWGINEPNNGSYEAYNFTQAKENFRNRIKYLMDEQKASLNNASKKEIKEFINVYNSLLQNENSKINDDNPMINKIVENVQETIIDKYIRDVDKNFIEVTQGGKFILDKDAANEVNKYRTEIRNAMNSKEFKDIYKNYDAERDKKPETVVSMTKFLYESIKKVSDANSGLTGLGIKSVINKLEEFMSTVESLVANDKRYTINLGKDGHISSGLEEAIKKKVKSITNKGLISSNNDFVKLINEVYLLLKYSAVVNAQGAYGELMAEIAGKIFKYDIANLNEQVQNDIIDTCKTFAKDWAKSSSKTGTLSTSLEYKSNNLNKTTNSNQNINEIFDKIENDIVKISAGSQKIDFELKNTNFRPSIKNYTLSNEHYQFIKIVDDTTLGALLTDISQEEGWDFAYHLYNLMSQANYPSKNKKDKFKAYKFQIDKTDKTKGNSTQKKELINCLSALKMYFLLNALSGPQNALNRKSANYLIINNASNRSGVKIFSIYDIVNYLIEKDNFLNNVLFKAKLGSSPLNGKFLKKDDLIPNKWKNEDGSKRLDAAKQRSTEMIIEAHKKKMQASINTAVFNGIKQIDI